MVGVREGEDAHGLTRRRVETHIADRIRSVITVTSVQVEDLSFGLDLAKHAGRVIAGDVLPVGLALDRPNEAKPT
jgi:hypothetical protein